MKVFAVHNIDGELVKTFASEANAFAWVKDQCQFWAKNIGEDCRCRITIETKVYCHADCDASGNEIDVRTEYTQISCQSGSEYTITPMDLE